MTHTPQPWISVVIPIKDERDNLLALTDQLIKVLQGREESNGAPFEIIYVDDGSTDGSSEILDRLATEHQAVTALHFDRNYGQSAGFDTGFKRSRGALVVTMDGDLQNDPEDIGLLLPYANDYDLVCGWRTERHDTVMRKISSRVANVVRNAVTGDRVHDTGCSLKVFRRRVIDRLQLFNGMHRFFPALALMHGFTVTEVPVRHHPRRHGISKYGVGNRLFKGVYDLMAVHWMQSRVLRYQIRGRRSDE
jgi:glycosyltransferase involved in cell wall biosynthesis